MSTSKANSASNVIGQGKIRVGVFVFAAFIILAFCFGGRFSVLQSFLSAFELRSEAVYSSAFTFQAIFWGASLTIWSLMKSRATRYIERIADNVAFQSFVQVLEIRLVIGLVSILFSFAMFIANPTLVGSWPLLAFSIWTFLTVASFTWLADSLLTARVVLN